MRVDKEFVLREIAGDYIIIPTGKTVLEFNGLITVNEVGVSIWNMLQKEVGSAGMDGPVPHGGSAPDPSDDL